MRATASPALAPVMSLLVFFLLTCIIHGDPRWSTPAAAIESSIDSKAYVDAVNGISGLVRDVQASIVQGGDAVAATAAFEEADRLSVRLYEAVRREEAPEVGSVYSAKILTHRANNLFLTGLGMSERNVQSGWARRALVAGHSLKVIAADLTSGEDAAELQDRCGRPHRRVLWGWEGGAPQSTFKGDPGLWTGPLRLPAFVNASWRCDPAELDGGGGDENDDDGDHVDDDDDDDDEDGESERKADRDTTIMNSIDRCSPTYAARFDIGPESLPPTFRGGLPGGDSGRGHMFTDPFNVRLVRIQGGYLAASTTVLDMSGVYSTNCSVLSLSKMENQVINQAYDGGYQEKDSGGPHSLGQGGQAATEIIRIDEPVLALVFASQRNWFHVIAETAPRLLAVLAEVHAAGRQYPHLAGSFGPATRILAVDTRPVRILLEAAGVPSHRIMWMRPRTGRRYYLSDALLVDYSLPSTPAAAATSAAATPDFNLHKALPALQRATNNIGDDASTKASSVGDLRDAWDGPPFKGRDIRSPYRPPRAALGLVRTSLGTGSMATAATQTTATTPRLAVYAGRRGEPARFVEEGERALVRQLRSALNNTAVDPRGFRLVSRPSRQRQTLREQAELFGAASILIGPHGAALTNMIWMRPGGAAVVFPLIPKVERCFEQMATGLGISYYEVPELSVDRFHGTYYAHEGARAAVVREVTRAAKGLIV